MTKRLIILAAAALMIDGIPFERGAELGVVDVDGAPNSEHCKLGRVVPTAEGVTFGHLDARLRTGLVEVVEAPAEEEPEQRQPQTSTTTQQTPPADPPADPPQTPAPPAPRPRTGNRPPKTKPPTGKRGGSK